MRREQDTDSCSYRHFPNTVRKSKNSQISISHTFLKDSIHMSEISFLFYFNHSFPGFQNGALSFQMLSPSEIYMNSSSSFPTLYPSLVFFVEVRILQGFVLICVFVASCILFPYPLFSLLFKQHLSLLPSLFGISIEDMFSV